VANEGEPLSLRKEASRRLMIECLTKLGRNVEIVVKSAPGSKAAGHVSVVFA